ALEVQRSGDRTGSGGLACDSSAQTPSDSCNQPDLSENQCSPDAQTRRDQVPSPQQCSSRHERLGSAGLRARGSKRDFFAPPYFNPPAIGHSQTADFGRRKSAIIRGNHRRCFRQAGKIRKRERTRASIRGHGGPRYLWGRLLKCNGRGTVREAEVWPVTLLLRHRLILATSRTYPKINVRPMPKHDATRYRAPSN